MKVIYDPHSDILDILLNDTPVAESDEGKPGVILDYDKDGNIVSIEVLDASKKIAHPKQMVYELSEQQ